LKNQQRKSKSRQKSIYFSFFRKVTPEGLILFNTTARMSVPKLVCEVPYASGFVWVWG
jgi:hypothetical protein